MSINRKPWKTEAIILYRGEDVKTEKSRLATTETTGHFSIFPGFDNDVQVDVVPKYKHLGSIITVSGSLVPETRQRMQSAMNALAPLAMKTFGSNAVGIQRRILLGWPSVVSRLSFTVHVWTQFPGKAPRIIMGFSYDFGVEFAMIRAIARPSRPTGMYDSDCLYRHSAAMLASAGCANSHDLHVRSSMRCTLHFNLEADLVSACHRLLLLSKI